ncbi:MAG: HD domain-containing protein [Bacteroidales bacterium]|nr:HD domain-containing protein [Bacteroidales bacterium]MDD5975087.1 HD domain-containing protein [Bacteroidales bacterium]MDY5194586.1 HD family phosphohydrolase [Candidatus Aphodosoma sp.]
MENNKEKFISYLKSTNREGVDYVIEDLEDLGFFTAPASTRFHLNEEEGLLVHSLNVCDMALQIRELILAEDDSLREKLPRESVIIAALLHDVCKADIYKKTIKKKKNNIGIWEDVEGYTVDYSGLPIGHGEKSVIRLLCSGLYLTDDEMLAIRWHMSSWDLPFQSQEMISSLNTAKNQCPLLSLIQAADGISANILELKKYEE